MPHTKRILALAALAVGAVPAADAAAAVSLSITDGVGAPTAGNANRGGTFTVTLNLTSTAEQTTGLDYFFQVAAAGSGLFSIADRNVGASTYSSPYFTDAVVEAPVSALLDPSNNNDLGGSLANVNAPNGAGTFLVANYTFSVAPTAPLGTYVISTFSSAGQGYVGAAPGFTESAFTAHATYSVTVVPEPTVAGGLAGLGLLAAGARRRRSTP